MAEQVFERKRRGEEGFSSFLQSVRRKNLSPVLLEDDKKIRPDSGYKQSYLTSHSETLLCHSSSFKRCRFKVCSGTFRSCEYLYHSNLYPYYPGKANKDL